MRATLGSVTSGRTSSHSTDVARGSRRGANFRLETRLGDLDIMQWVAGIDSEPAYEALDDAAIEVSSPASPCASAAATI